VSSAAVLACAGIAAFDAPLGAVFWIGFDLPSPPIIAVLRTALIALSWNSLE